MTRVNSESAEPIVFLDRDGTINIDRHYLSDPAGLELLPGAAEGLRRMSVSGRRLVIATNQSGVGRGLMSSTAAHAVNSRLLEMLTSEHVPIATVVSCFHTPEDRCLCRKPGRGLADEAIAKIGGTLSRSVVIGDKSSDIGFAHKIGARSILIVDDVKHAPSYGQTWSASNLIEAARILNEWDRGGEP